MEDNKTNEKIELDEAEKEADKYEKMLDDKPSKSHKELLIFIGVIFILIIAVLITLLCI